MLLAESEGYPILDQRSSDKNLLKFFIVSQDSVFPPQHYENISLFFLLIKFQSQLKRLYFKENIQQTELEGGRFGRHGKHNHQTSCPSLDGFVLYREEWCGP